MVYWIKKTAWMLGVMTFFTVLLLSLDFNDLLNLEMLIMSLVKSCAGAALFWFAGFVLGDILLKGIVTEIDTEAEHMLEGGLLQRVHDHRIRSAPGAEEMPIITFEKTKSAVAAENKE